MSLETNSCLRLLTSNTRLTFLSSTPTAPALFEVDVRGKTLKSRKPGSQCWLFHTLGSEKMRNEILISSLKMDPMTPASQGWAAVMREHVNAQHRVKAHLTETVPAGLSPYRIPILWLRNAMGLKESWPLLTAPQAFTTGLTALWLLVVLKKHVFQPSR